VQIKKVEIKANCSLQFTTLHLADRLLLKLLVEVREAVKERKRKYSKTRGKKSK